MGSLEGLASFIRGALLALGPVLPTLRAVGSRSLEGLSVVALAAEANAPACPAGAVALGALVEVDFRLRIGGWGRLALDRYGGVKQVIKAYR